jgi:hypothetical protein
MIKKISKIKREGNVYWIDFEKKKFNISDKWRNGAVYKLSILYHGNPVVAKRPPWMVVGYLQRCKRQTMDGVSLARD